LLDEKKIPAHLHLVDDLGADSLEILEITVALNERLNIEIPEHALAHVSTVGQLCALAQGQLE